MKNDHNPLIDTLVADLDPVRPLRMGVGGLWVLIGALVSLALVLIVNGVATALLAGQISQHFLMLNLMLLALGIAASASAVSMAMPRVGSRYDGINWAIIAFAAIIIISQVATSVPLADYWARLDIQNSWHCAAEALVASLSIAGALILWLRRGAPVDVRRAGLHLGIGATALGSAVYGLSCPVDTDIHLGFWHCLPVAVGALAGRFGAARLLRW